MSVIFSVSDESKVQSLEKAIISGDMMCDISGDLMYVMVILLFQTRLATW